MPGSSGIIYCLSRKNVEEVCYQLREDVYKRQVYELIDAGEEVVIIDNLETGHIEAVHPKAKFYKGDLRDKAFVDSVLDQEKDCLLYTS